MIIVYWQRKIRTDDTAIPQLDSDFEHTFSQRDLFFMYFTLTGILLYTIINTLSPTNNAPSQPPSQKHSSSAESHPQQNRTAAGKQSPGSNPLSQASAIEYRR